MANPLFDPSQWQDSDANGGAGASPPITWNSVDQRYEFISKGDYSYDLGLIYIGNGIIESFSFNAAQSYDSDTIIVTADGNPTNYSLPSNGSPINITVNPCTTLNILFNTTVNSGPYGVDAYIEPIEILTPTPTPSLSPIQPTPTPNNQSNNIKQMFRRYNDGTLVARDQQYDLLKGFQFIQNDESATWEVCHNMQSNKFTQSVLIQDVLTDCDVQIVDKCKILLQFKTPVSGYANFVFLDTFPTTSVCACVPTETPTVSSTPTPTPMVTPSPSGIPTIFASNVGNLNMGSEGSANMTINLYSEPLCGESRTPLITNITNISASWLYYGANCSDPLIQTEDSYCQQIYSTSEPLQQSGSFSFVPTSNGDGTYFYIISSDDGAGNLLNVLIPSQNKLVIINMIITTDDGILSTSVNYDVWGC